MHIRRLVIRNFKKFKSLDIVFAAGLNVLVGDNEAGKSTILEAVDLALSGIYNNRYIKNELSQSLFNNESVETFLSSLSTGSKLAPPEISIAIHFGGDGLDKFNGDGNDEGIDSCGFTLRIGYDERNNDLYEEWIQCGEFSSLPIEFYTVRIDSFQRDSEVTFRHIPLKSALIDASSAKGTSGSDLYVSKIIKDLLEPKELIDISQAFRKSKDIFSKDTAVTAINSKIETAASISTKKVTISIDQVAKNAWESGLFTHLDGVPFAHIGKGEQSMVKTKIALAHKKAREKNVILIEEPENHLSHSKLNELLNQISSARGTRQVIISTHSSYVANKLGLDSLILLANCKHTKFTSLSESTRDFFLKIPGYNTLRLVLCRRAILVEGDCDELIVQRAYMDANSDKLPISDGIDVISVGTAFLRFLEIAKLIKSEVRIVTDNDGYPERVTEKYKDYVSDEIKLCCDTTVDTGYLVIMEGGKDKGFNYNTLEPKLLKANSISLFAKIFGVEFSDVDAVHKYMRTNKTECALKIFSSKEKITYPQYILDAIKA